MVAADFQTVLAALTLLESARLTGAIHHVVKVSSLLATAADRVPAHEPSSGRPRRVAWA